jgi:hypothetical protein
MNRFVRAVSALLLATLLTSGRARAEDRVYRWSIQVGSGASYITSNTLDFLAASDAMQVGEIRVGYVPDIWNNHFEIDLGYVGTSLTGTAFQTWQTELQVHSLQLGLRYLQPLGRYFSAYGRAAGILQFDGVSVSPGDNSLPSAVLGQWVTTGGLLLNAGLEWHIYSWVPAQLGLLAEFGYAFVGAAAFNHVTANIQAGSSPSSIPIASQKLGTLDPSGIQWRLAAAVHF